MPEIVTWQQNVKPRDAVGKAVRALASGQLVGFPTETVYGIAASALAPGAVERLRQCKDRPEDKPLTLAIAGAEDALDWVPGMGLLGRRLAWRCWPGPVTLVYEDGVAGGLTSRLPETVRQRVCPTGRLGLRAPAHKAIRQTMRRLGAPLILTSANRSGEADAISAEQVVQAVGEHLALVVDDGPSRYGRASTVVQVNEESWKVLREGVVSPATLQYYASCIILFVCTGNTCRSPLAEVLCKKLLSDRLGCAASDLPKRGFVVLSAGLAAMLGGGAAPEAVEVARELGGDLSSHSSQPISRLLLEQADHVIAMTRGHLLALDNKYRGLHCRPRLLCPGGKDIPDPIGCAQHVYRECAQQIFRHLERLLPEVQTP